MIIDCKADIDHARQHEILDATTWQPLSMDEVYSHVWYADDQKGILRIVLLDEKGMLQLAMKSDPQTPLSDSCWASDDRGGNGIIAPVAVAWREEKRPIRIVKKG